MVSDLLTVPSFDGGSPPSPRSSRARRKRHPNNVFFRRVYSGSKAVQAKVTDVMGGEEEHDFSTIPVDEDGLPLTYSDLITGDFGASTAYLFEKQRKEQEEQERALNRLVKASQVVSRLSFEQKRHRYSSDGSSTSEFSATECPGPNSLEELNQLRTAVNNLSQAYDLADPSPNGRQARREIELIKADEESKLLSIPTIKRKSIPDYDCPVDIIAPEDINPYLLSPEPREELANFATSPLMMRTPKSRGIYTARALRKLEIDRVSSESSLDESSDEEDRSIAHYYITKHRASRKNEVGAVVQRSKRSSKSARRRTSIMVANRDDVQHHLLIQANGLESKLNFSKSLDDEHRRATAPPFLNTLISSGDSDDDDDDNNRRSSTISNSSMTSSSSTQDDSDTPESLLISFHSSSTLVDDGNEMENKDEENTWTSNLAGFSPSSIYFSGEEEEVTHQIVNPMLVMSKRSPTALQPPRPKRHPLRPDSLSMTRIVKVSDSKLEYSSDVTPRPSALTFASRVDL